MITLIKHIKRLAVVTSSALITIVFTIKVACNVYSMMIVPLITYSTTHRIPHTYMQYNKLELLSRYASLVIKCNDSLPSINGLVNCDISLLVKKFLLKDLNSGTFDNYFILQEPSKKHL